MACLFLKLKSCPALQLVANALLIIYKYIILYMYHVYTDMLQRIHVIKLHLVLNSAEYLPANYK